MPAKRRLRNLPGQRAVYLDDGTAFLVHHKAGSVEIYGPDAELVYITRIQYDAQPAATLDAICDCLANCFDPMNPVELVFSFGGWTPAYQPPAVNFKAYLC